MLALLKLIARDVTTLNLSSVLTEPVRNTVANLVYAPQQIGRFLEDVYTHQRVHSSLGYLAPPEFEMQWRREQAAARGMS